MSRRYIVNANYDRTAIVFFDIYLCVADAILRQLPLYKIFYEEMRSQRVSFSIIITYKLVNRCFIRNRERFVDGYDEELFKAIVYKETTPEIINNCVAYEVEQFLSKMTVRKGSH